MTPAMLSILASISAANARVAAMEARNLEATSSQYVPYSADAFFAESDNLECFAAQSLALAKEVVA